MLTNTELYSTYLTCKELSNSNKRLSIRVRNSDTLISQLTDETSFLPESSDISERLYCYVNNISEIPKCPYCGHIESDWSMEHIGVPKTQDEYHQVGHTCSQCRKSYKITAYKG